MKRVVLTFAVLAAALIPAVAQKIESQTSDRTRIVHLKTALNHLTVIEVADPVTASSDREPVFQGGVAGKQSICSAHRSRRRHQLVHLDREPAAELRTGASRSGDQHEFCRRPSPGSRRSGQAG